MAVVEVGWLEGSPSFMVLDGELSQWFRVCCCGTLPHPQHFEPFRFYSQLLYRHKLRAAGDVALTSRTAVFSARSHLDGFLRHAAALSETPGSV